MVEGACQPGVRVGMFPVGNRIAHEKMKKSLVSGRDSPADIGFIQRCIAEKKLSLSDKLFW
jgi:hypothetical protein